MNITLLTLNYSPELTGIGKYNGEMCPWFVSEGVLFSVICAVPYYPEWAVQEKYKKIKYYKSIEKGVYIERCPIYVPKKLSFLKRLMHLITFATTSAISLIRYYKRPCDVIMVVQPTLFSVPAALLFAKFKKSKSILHIQDFEVDAMFGLGMARTGFISKLAYKVEGYLLRRFDAVSSISYSMLEKAISKGVSKDKIIFFPNWSDISFVTPNVDGSDLRHQWGVLPNEKVILYAGNIGQKQGLELVLEAAQRYQNKRNIKFFIVGSGAYVDELKQLSDQYKLKNVFFKPLQNWENVPSMLAMADVHLVVQKKGAADVVLPSKLTNILSAGGNAVVTAEKSTELGKIADSYPGIYSLVEPEDINAFCQGLEFELSKTGINSIARQYAEDNLDKEAILQRFKTDLEKLVSTS